MAWAAIEVPACIFILWQFWTPEFHDKQSYRCGSPIATYIVFSVMQWLQFFKWLWNHYYHSFTLFGIDPQSFFESQLWHMKVSLALMTMLMIYLLIYHALPTELLDP